MLSSITGPCFSCRAAGLFFFSAFLVNLLAGIVFLLGSNVAIVCDDLPDYKLLQKVSELCVSSPTQRSVTRAPPSSSGTLPRLRSLLQTKMAGV